MQRRQDDNLSSAEKWAIYFKKYGVVGLGVVLAPILWPVAIEWVSGKIIDNKMKPVMRKLDKLEDEILYSRAYSSVSAMKTLVSADDWNIMVRHRVRSQSLDKVKEIKFIWEFMPKETEAERKRLWTRVKNILYSNTNVYVNELKQYGHPIIGNIGLYLNKTFPMYKSAENGQLRREYRPDYSFLAVVYAIVMETKYDDVDEMADALTEYMKAIQDEYFTDHYRIIKKLESKVSLSNKLANKEN